MNRPPRPPELPTMPAPPRPPSLEPNRPPLVRRPFPLPVAREAVPSRGSSAVGLQQFLLLVGVLLVGVHMTLARATFLPLPRFLLAVPGVLLLWEINRYYERSKSGERELPVLVVGLLTYYVA